jgi:thiol:disulfide interchange protein
MGYKISYSLSNHIEDQMTILWMTLVTVALAANPFRVEVLPTQLESGKKGEVLVTFVVPEGYHLYHDMMSVDIVPITGLVFEPAVFPMGHLIADPANPTQLREVFDATIQVKVPVTSSTIGTYPTDITVQFQGCKDTLCYMPKSETVSTSIQVSPLLLKSESSAPSP